MNDLVASTVAFLAPMLPYLLKAGEKAAKEAAQAVGKGAWDCAKAIWTRLGPNLASFTLFLFAALPRDARVPARMPAVLSARRADASLRQTPARSPGW